MNELSEQAEREIAEELRKAAELSTNSIHNGLKKCNCGACGRLTLALRGALEGEDGL